MLYYYYYHIVYYYTGASPQPEHQAQIPRPNTPKERMRGNGWSDGWIITIITIIMIRHINKNNNMLYNTNSNNNVTNNNVLYNNNNTNIIIMII